MRVVAGLAGSVPLVAPPFPARPTMDRVREAIFSSLGDFVLGARVLDLFSGSGSFGLEALSRGAASAVLVESCKPCLEAMQKNIEKTKLVPRVEGVDVFSYLGRPVGAGAFDLVFADPPYKKRKEDPDYAGRLLGVEALVAALAEGGVFILETHVSWRLPEAGFWESIRQKRYGETSVWTLVKNG